jgi:predicted CXXCH cytochrome family protein
MVQEIAKNPDVVTGDFTKPDPVRPFDLKDAIYTIGNQWKQRYITKIGDELFILPAQYNLETGRWVPYHAKNWKERPWLKNCGGCHVTGLDYEKRAFIEPGVGCEACHGPGDKHVGAKPGEYAKHIVNPANLPVGAAVQVCGSCHTRGKDVSGKHGYPKGYKPGKSLLSFYKEVRPGKDKKRFWPDGSSKSHHQQYLDWRQSRHAREGVTCISCHTVHSTGSATRYQTRLPGNTLCMSCHQQIKRNPTMSHSLHDFGSCVGCHMPRIVKSAESGDLHSHTFRVTEPKLTVAAGGLKKQPNSCNSCHSHKNDDPAKLQEALDKARAQNPWSGILKR